MNKEKPGPPGAGFNCPLPVSAPSTIQLAHGAGGRLTQSLVEGLFLRAFDNPWLRELHDGALLEVNGSRIAFSTDSYVVHPLFFPGGDIGSLAVHGTVNDLAMCGAAPVGLSVGLIIEEGLALEDLTRIAHSIGEAARRVDVPVVTGDTKVVDRGKGDGLFVNTTGLGLVRPGVELAPSRARCGDRVLISGSIAVHGVAVLSVREGLEFGTKLESDSAPLHDLVRGILDVAGNRVHVLRDPTRGGVASALNEIAGAAGVGIHLEERSIPVREEVRAACEMLGLDPLHVANEGKCLVIAAGEVAQSVLEALRAHPLGREAAIVGKVVEDHPGKVVMRSSVGGSRIVDMPSGDPLPRIC